MKHLFFQRIGIGLLYSVFLSGCANTGSANIPADTIEQQKCSFDETYSCIERIGHPVRCFCADKDTIRELLEPTVE